MCDVINFVFSRAYLAHPWSIFSQISVCYSWENSLSERCNHFPIGWRHHGQKVGLKETLQNLPGLRVMSMGQEFFSNLDLTLQRSSSCISVIYARFSSKFWYVIAETISFRKCDLHFSIRRRDHGANFDWKLDFRSTQGRFLAHVLSLWGNFWCSGRVICLPT